MNPVQVAIVIIVLVISAVVGPSVAMAHQAIIVDDVMGVQDGIFGECAPHVHDGNWHVICDSSSDVHCYSSVQGVL